MRAALLPTSVCPWASGPRHRSPAAKSDGQGRAAAVQSQGPEPSNATPEAMKRIPHIVEMPLSPPGHRLEPAAMRCRRYGLDCSGALSASDVIACFIAVQINASCGLTSIVGGQDGARQRAVGRSALPGLHGLPGCCISRTGGAADADRAGAPHDGVRVPVVSAPAGCLRRRCLAIASTACACQS